MADTHKHLVLRGISDVIFLWDTKNRLVHTGRLYTRAGLDCLLACFHLFGFFPLCRWKIFTLLFLLCFPHSDSRPPPCKAPWKQHWLPSPTNAGSLDSPEAGSVPHCSAKHQELASRALFHPHQPGDTTACLAQGSRTFYKPWWCLGFLTLQNLDAPDHPSARHTMERGKIPKIRVRAVGSAPLWSLGFAASPHPQ